MGEMDILPAAIADLRRIGVGPTILLDYGSTDGSLEWVEGLGPEADIHVLHRASSDADAVWDRIRLEMAHRLDIDRLLMVDADEFLAA
jgi:hypothetical protein